MSTALTFCAAFALIGAVLYALSRLKDRDLSAAATATGLARVPHSPGTKGPTAEGWPCRDIVVATGTLVGVQASLISRSIPKQFAPKSDKVATQFTVLALHLPAPPPAMMRLQPVGWTRAIEAITHAVPSVVSTGDVAFDSAWHLYTDTPAAALLILTPDLRRSLIDLRGATLPDGPAWTGGATAALLLGTFDITPARATYAVFGSPVKETGEHVARAQPLLARLAALGEVR
jgi:hypothetical protein